MAAYAVLLSLRHIIEHLQNHPRPPITLDQNLAQSLIQNVTFLQEFLEGYSEYSDALESRIADAAYAAEDLIESHIVDQIQARGEKINSIDDDLYQSLKKKIKDMDLITREVTNVKEKTRIQHQPQKNSSASSGLLRSLPMVGFNDVLIETMDKLTGQRSSRQVIVVVGMGGIGKTTLARNIYVNQLIVQYFDILVWVTISQEYNVREVLLESLVCQKHMENTEYLNGKSEHELGLLLHKSLSGRRYLIVMDDLWGVEAWDSMKLYFPDNNNGSRIVITTRLSNVVAQVTDSDNVLNMKFLNEGNSWNLFCKSVFEEQVCPLELKEVGKEIAKSCKGLPLSITVIGGLAKSKQTREYWEYILKNLNPILNSEDNEHCLKILRMSYKEMPVHLKPCFLYIGIFPEDYAISISRLIKLWVAEGFLKTITGKSLEVAGEEYLKDLVDRNLILVHKLGSTGKIKYCKIHDLLRDACLKEAKKDKFLCFRRPYDLESLPHDIQSPRRVGFYQSTRGKFVGTLPSTSLRSSLCNSDYGTIDFPFLHCKLLRVLMAGRKIDYNQESYSPKTIFQLVNSRYLEVVFNWDPIIPSSVDQFWNLQTLVVKKPHWNVVMAPVEMWKMPQLRHVMIDKLELADPLPVDDECDFVVLENLQTLSVVRNFKCSEDVVNRIPYVKKLEIYYDDLMGSTGTYCLDNLCRLCKLESLSCDFGLLSEARRSCLLQRLNFPRSLNALTLEGTWLRWEDMTMTGIGLLPHLQLLMLHINSFIGSEWETVEGQFPSLKCLKISLCGELEYWRTESTHFPCLERLVLEYMIKLKEIPLEIGDIPAMKSIELKYCTDSSVASAKRIRDEQEELGNVGFRVNCLR